MNFGKVRDHGHTYEVLFEQLFSLKQFLNMAMVRNFEVILR
jgi:hypothetical protein